MKSKKIKIKIVSWLSGSVLFEYEAVDNTIKKTVEKAVASSANLSSADLRSANLSYANLSSANLSSADLRYADLSSANLSSADLRSANLRYANLSYADLSYADLSYADLSSANLRYANLSYANLSSANLSSADLRSADLRSAKNITGDYTDFWWHVHHEILVEQLNEPLRARINYIKKEKAKNESKAKIALRLKLLHPVLGDIPTTDKGWDALHKKECPKCPWNGKTIFTKKP